MTGKVPFSVFSHRFIITFLISIHLPLRFLNGGNNHFQSSFWASKWGMRFQPVKCNMMLLTKKHNKIDVSYMQEGTVLENVGSIKYLGVTIASDLKWNSHIRNVCYRANITLSFLRRNLFSCPQDVKEAAY